MKIVISVLVVSISLIIFAVSCNDNSNSISEALKNESVKVLRENVFTHAEWIKVHAAEFLLWSGYPKDIQSVFLEEEKRWGDKSPYRIGIWRVLFQAEIKPEKKKIWSDKIIQAFLDENGSDRIHAVETLAKLHISPLPEHSDVIAKCIDSTVKSLSLYTYWSVSFYSTDSLVSVRNSIFQILTSINERSASRRLAAYILRQIGGLTKEEWLMLAKSALMEPDESEVKIYLINAAVISANENIAIPDMYQRVYDALLKYKAVKKKAVRIEILTGLAEKGKLEDLPILISFMRNDNPLGQESEDADVRSFAAYAILKMSDRLL